MSLIWEDPPGARATHSWLAEAQELRAHPGEWAMVCVKPHARAAAAMASQIRSGRLAAFSPPGSFEALSRAVDGQARVYARYIGSQSGAAL